MRYRAICEYETVCNSVLPIDADSEEEAIKKAREDFLQWNEKWMKDYNGNEKKLKRIWIEK